MALPPGLLFLLPKIPQLLVPPVTVCLLAYLARVYFSYAVPAWALAVACILSLPAAFTILVQWYDHKIYREATARGSKLPCAVKCKYLGGVDILTKYTKEWAQEYGWTYNFRLLFRNTIFTAEPEYIKVCHIDCLIIVLSQRILATDFQGFEKGSLWHNQLKSLLGSGVFNVDGDLWKFHRAMTRPFFSRDRISHFDVFDRHAEEALNHAKARVSEGVPFDWQDLVSRFTLDSATDFLFGKDVRSLSAPLPYPPTSPQAQHDTSASHPANRFARAFHGALIASAKRSRYTTSWPLWEFWKSKVDEHIEVLEEFIQPLLHDALARKAKSPEVKVEVAVEDNATLLEHLVKLTDDPQIIRDETVNILLASRDTTAITLTMAGYMLAEHPDILQRLRKEILGIVGTRRPTYDDIRDMKFLRAFINEVLRMYPPIPFNVRFSTAPTVWPSPEGDYYFPGGTRCLYSVFCMQRRKDLWGPDADRFDPDRFLDERLQKYLSPNPFIFLPFNAGPRICPGQQFAYNEVSFMLIRLLQHVSKIELHPDANPESVAPPGWDVSSLSDGQDKVIVKSHLTIYVAGGLWVKMQFEDPEGH
ncbi:uncharacterized protein PHACADRAFT_109856 [Phanerochaete carnosa HHB-10118-sp]|uniref:Cytochrome P450 monooxygenase pc-3 n=1 Tax=Phanerochaete carnosa (strain HHB-10118-sp) TaxID=650164 RepID=K5W8Z9_PHACS|nr:uncharacterized protein PHACADRAFT_109856 [Phanerochaete carnosa HHB-10118-sp]EKM60403.1 hypothetical protein PHACADRAFT_109856 [Phanerochaete carnosa HHB-10118-sp]